MKKIILSFVLLFSLFTITIHAREFVDPSSDAYKQMNRVNNSDITFEYPRFIFSHTNTVITMKFKDARHPKLEANNYKLHFIVNGNDQLVQFDKNGVGTFSTAFTNSNKLNVLFEDASYNMQMPVISIWYMILPLGGLLVFLLYKIAFSKKGLTVVSKIDVTEKHIENSETKFKIVNIKSREEEEILV